MQFFTVFPHWQNFLSLSLVNKRERENSILMNRNHHHPSELPDSPAINVGSEGVSDQNFHSIRDRFLFKRNPNPSTNSPPKSSKSPPDRLRRWHHYTNKSNYRKGGWFSCIPFRGIYLLYFVIFFAVLAFVLASILLQSSITGMVVFSKGWVDYRRSIREGLKSGTILRFVPGLRSRLLLEGHGLDHVREQANRVGLRPPRLAVVSFRLSNFSFSFRIYFLL